MSFLRELLEFLGARKKYWLYPVVIIMVLLGMLLIVAQSSVVAPFIYAIF